MTRCANCGAERADAVGLVLPDGREHGFCSVACFCTWTRDIYMLGAEAR